MNPNIFRAYDIRGLYPEEINEEVVGKIGKVLGKYFGGGKIVVGYDARLSSLSLYKTLNDELRIMNNVNLLEAGLITTPMLTFLVNKLGASGGVMITASHNPKEYNGLKMVGRGGIPISGEEIYNLIVINNQ